LISAKFKIESDFSPQGDQPEAIKALAKNIESNQRFQTLLGATGTGKSLDYYEKIIYVD
jgi:excinuclease ABC subunit B